MKLIKLLAVVVIVLVLLAVLIPNLKNRAIAGGRGVGKALDEISSLNHLVGVAEAAADEAEDQVRDFTVQIAQSSAKRDSLAQDLEELEQTKQDKEEIARNRQRFLVENKNNKDDARYVSRGRSFSYSQVEQDVILRVEKLKTMDEAIEEKQNIVNGLNADIAVAETELANCHTALNEYRQQIESWQSKIDAAETRIKAQAITDAIGSNPLAKNTNLKDAMDALKNRFYKADALIRMRANRTLASENGQIIPDDDLPSRNALDVVNEYFGDSGTGSDVQSDEQLDLIPDSVN